MSTTTPNVQTRTRTLPRASGGKVRVPPPPDTPAGGGEDHDEQTWQKAQHAARRSAKAQGTLFFAVPSGTRPPHATWTRPPAS